MNTRETHDHWRETHEHCRRTLVEYLTASATAYEHRSLSKSPTCSSMVYSDAFKRLASVLDEEPFIDDHEAVEHITRATKIGRGDLVSQEFRFQVKTLIVLLVGWRTAMLADNDCDPLNVANVSDLIQQLGQKTS